MVTDVNSKANSRMNAYNMYWVPSCYYDGGYQYNDGQSQSSITSRILLGGQRAVPTLDLTVSMSWLENNTIEVEVSLTNNNFVNTPPQTPAAPSGPTASVMHTPVTFSAVDDDPDGHQLYYMWDWGDGIVSDWMGPYASGEVMSADHAWTTLGYFDVKVKAKDEMDAETAWSSLAGIEIGVPGDANGDNSINIGDAVFVINYVFKHGTVPDPIDGADSNCDSSVNIGDAVYIINFVFKHGAAPGC